MQIRRGAVALTALFSAGLSAGCSSSGDSAYDATCRIEYVSVGGEASSRYDLVTIETDGSTVTRLIFDEGGAVPNRAIYYYHDAEGRLVVEALDDAANGDIEARMDADASLTDDITPLIVDTNLRDGAVDALQLSIPLPTSTIGPWNPARLFYTIPCDQGRAESREINAQRVEVDVFDDDPEDEDGVPEASFAIDRTPEGVVQGWSVDVGSDGTLDDIATVTYDTDGLVTRVEWARPNEVLGDVYASARYIYDTDGRLFAYVSDADGDGVADNEIRYSAGCFAPSGSTTGGQ